MVSKTTLVHQNIRKWVELAIGYSFKVYTKWRHVSKEKRTPSSYHINKGKSEKPPREPGSLAGESSRGSGEGSRALEGAKGGTCLPAPAENLEQRLSEGAHWGSGRARRCLDKVSLNLGGESGQGIYISERKKKKGLQTLLLSKETDIK